MLADTDALATIPVKTLASARKFYEETLGLRPEGGDSQPSVATYRSGKSKILVYESEFAGTNKATAATWIVGNEIDAIVKRLQSKGATFEHYDMPDLELRGDIHVNGDMKVAWVRDPDGNILSFVNG